MYCFNFFRNQLWQHLISYNSFRNMNICLLEVVMCEKCRSSHFQSETGGLKNFRTGGVTFAGGGSVFHFMPCNLLFQVLFTPLPFLSTPTPTPTALFVVLFLWLNVWWHHIWCAILLNEIMELHMLSHGTLVSKGHWCVFYAMRQQVYWGVTHGLLLVLWFDIMYAHKDT